VKIGILGQDFVSWSGGVDFLWLVVDSLMAVDRTEQVEYHLLIPDSGPRLNWRRTRGRIKEMLKPFSSKKKPAGTPGPSPKLIEQIFSPFQHRLKIHHIDVGRRALAGSVKRLGLEVVLPALHSPGSDFPRPWVGYAYDFQHKYFPQNFPPEDCRSRDEHFADMLAQARAVIVNSRAAAADIAKFVPQGTARVFALPFAPAPGRDWLEDRPEVLPRYDLVPPFFVISNQFWVHKDHSTAFEAFRSVAGHNADVLLVCTGSTEGARDAGYFPGLMAKLKEWGLEGRVRVLGLIPKHDQIEIMKHACAVVQPTLFEGGPGGGAVYDAISLGVPAIVSDIPVNREIEDEQVDFFPAGDAAKLALLMEARLGAPQRRVFGGDLVIKGKRRRAACGAVLWKAVEFVADNR
jgi:glycosyltransferase involved in cell wall biosynthesis